ncbi:sensor histidine kinase [Limnohabitans sp.]
MKPQDPIFSQNLWTTIRFSLGLLGTALLLASVYAWGWSMTGDAFGQISQGKINILRHAMLGLGPEIQSAPATAQQVTLPHRTHDIASGMTDYRIAFKVETATHGETDLALCVPRWSINASVWLDGQKLLSPDQSRLNFHTLLRPAFIALPVFLAPGEHRIDIRLRTVPGTFPELSEVWWGRQAAVARECGALQDLQVGLRIGGLLLMMFIALVSVSVFASQRDKLSLGFSMASLGWCLHNFIVLDWLGPLSETAWITSFMVTRPMMGFAGIYVLLCLVNNRHRFWEWGLLATMLLAYIALAVLPSSYWQLWLLGLGLVVVPLTLIAGVYLLWYTAARTHYLSNYAFAMSTFFGVGANAMDIARVKGLLPYSALSMTIWVAPLLAMSIGMLVIERLVSYLRYKKEAAISLQQELAAQKIQLAAVHAEVQAQREKILLTEERQRLVRDMHDGLGSQLVSASALLKSGPMVESKAVELSELIDHALLDLRSMLDVFSSHQFADGDESQDAVSLLLAMLRHRLAPVFRSQGVAFDWQTEPMPHSFLTSDQDRLQLLRLLQEACTNIIKHANAHAIALRTHVSESAIVFEVSDDGQGIEASQLKSGKYNGHGLANMADRAARMGAQLVIESTHEGTCVRLIFQR